MKDKIMREQKRRVRTRAKIAGTKTMPRLSVYRSNSFMYAQLIDDSTADTVVAASEKELDNTKVTKTERAKQVGMLLAKKAIDAKVKRVVFDRGPYQYHGRIKAVAEGAREGGLEF